MRLWFVFKPRDAWDRHLPWFARPFRREPHVFVVLAASEGVTVILNPRRHILEVQAIVAWPWQVLRQAHGCGYTAVFYEACGEFSGAPMRPFWTCATACAYAANLPKWFARPSRLKRWLLENGGTEVQWETS